MQRDFTKILIDLRQLKNQVIADEEQGVVRFLDHILKIDIKSRLFLAHRIDALAGHFEIERRIWHAGKYVWPEKRPFIIQRMNNGSTPALREKGAFARRKRGCAGGQ